MKKLLLSVFMAVAAFCTASAEVATFDFTTNQYGQVVGDEKTDNYLTVGTCFSQDLVTVTVTNTEKKVRFFKASSGTINFRINKGGSVDLSVPSGNIVKIELKGSNLTSFTIGGTTVPTSKTAAEWTGTAPSVTIDNNKQVGTAQISTMKVTYSTSGETKELAGLSFPENSYKANLGEPFTAPVLTKATDAAATYTSSETSVATVDAATGAVTLLSAGTTVITASTAETAKYYSGTAHYTLVVIDPNAPGATIGNPMTVAQALAAADGTKDVYVKGYVTEVIDAYSEKYKNVSFNIADQAGDATVMKAFRANWGADVTATADNNPEVGAVVILYGNIALYNNVNQLAAGCKIVSYSSPSGIADIEADNIAAPVYYNLQGVRVANPENGLFIEVRGNKAVKVIK